MRKGGVSPGVLLAGVVLFLITALYGGRGPEGRHPSDALPLPAEGTLFLHYEGTKASGLSPLLKAMATVGGERAPTLDALFFVPPLFLNAGETAALLAWEENALHFYMAARLPKEHTQAISEGVFPKGIAPTLTGVSLQEVSPGIFGVRRKNEDLSLFISVNGGITLFASSPEKMSRMALTLERQAEPIDIAWKLERRWPNHIFFSDGGFFSGIASMEGLPAAKENLLVTAAWRDEDDGGRMEWHLEGLDTIFPPSLLKEFRKAHWGGRYTFPEPLVAAVGFTIPERFAAFLEDGRMSEAFGLWENADELIKGLLAGPCILSLCGSSKFLVYSLPGVLLQLPERGREGETFAEAFWKKEWSSLVPGVEKLDGFPVGGTTAIPFSIVAAANFRMLQLGLIDRDALRHERFRSIYDYAPLLSDIENAFFWSYLDIPKIASALQDLAKIGQVAAKMGKNLRVSPNALFQAADALKEMGGVTIVMPAPEEGFLEWRKTKDAAPTEEME